MIKDAKLKSIFNKQLNGNNFKKELQNSVKTLVEYAYSRLDNDGSNKEKVKDPTKGVAFVRTLWKKEDLQNDKSVIKCPLLNIVKLYKAGLQANAGWFGRLPGKEIQKYAIKSLEKYMESWTIDKDDQVPWYLNLGVIQKECEPDEIKTIVPSTVKSPSDDQVEIFIKKIKNISPNSSKEQLEQWIENIKQLTNKLYKKYAFIINLINQYESSTGINNKTDSFVINQLQYYDERYDKENKFDLNYLGQLYYMKFGGSSGEKTKYKQTTTGKNIDSILKKNDYLDFTFLD